MKIEITIQEGDVLQFNERSYKVDEIEMHLGTEEATLSTVDGVDIIKEDDIEELALASGKFVHFHKDYADHDFSF